MTMSHYSWVIAENCHWPVNDSLQEVFKNCHLLVNDSFALQLGNCRKLSLTGQWQFRRVDTMDQGAPLQNCHWPVNDSFGGSTPWTKVHLYKTVIDRSMTILASIRNGLSQKIVIDWSMTVLGGRHRGPRCTFTKLSLTGQWQFWLA